VRHCSDTVGSNEVRFCPPRDAEANRFSAVPARYVRVGANVGGVAAKIAATRLLGLDGNAVRGAADLRGALGASKGRS